MEPWGRQAACPPSDGDGSPSCAGHCQGPAPSWEPVTQRGATQGHPVSGPVRDHLLDTQLPSRRAPKPDAHLNPCTQPDPGPGRSSGDRDQTQKGIGTTTTLRRGLGGRTARRLPSRPGPGCERLATCATRPSRFPSESEPFLGDRATESSALINKTAGQKRTCPRLKWTPGGCGCDHCTFEINTKHRLPPRSKRTVGKTPLPPTLGSPRA